MYNQIQFQIQKYSKHLHSNSNKHINKLAVIMMLIPDILSGVCISTNITYEQMNVKKKVTLKTVRMFQCIIHDS